VGHRRRVHCSLAAALTNRRRNYLNSLGVNVFITEVRSVEPRLADGPALRVRFRSFMGLISTTFFQFDTRQGSAITF
jgi:hypothetical protein